MDSLSRTEDIELGCDLAFERRWWRVQRISWIVLSLLLIGGVVGLFGHGPLSTTTSHPPGSLLEVKYDRLARRETPSFLELRLDRAALISGTVRLHLNHVLISDMQLKQIVPQPKSAEPLGEGVCYTFEVDPSRDSAYVVFTVSPSSPGFFTGEITVEGAEPVRFRQFVFP